jgi:hypothetical protein
MENTQALVASDTYLHHYKSAIVWTSEGWSHLMLYPGPLYDDTLGQFLFETENNEVAIWRSDESAVPGIEAITFSET